MISEKLQGLLNDQIRKELYSAYLYLSMEAYYTSLNLAGFANWFRVQAQEERDHALIIFNYINRVGSRVKLGQIDAPPWDFSSIEGVLDLTYEHEQVVTASIYNIVDVAKAERDHKTDLFLQWFVNEQVEEELNADNNVRKYKLTGGDSKGLMMMDAEMATRVYIVAPPLLPGAQG